MFLCTLLFCYPCTYLIHVHSFFICSNWIPCRPQTPALATLHYPVKLYSAVVSLSSILPNIHAAHPRGIPGLRLMHIIPHPCGLRNDLHVRECSGKVDEGLWPRPAGWLQARRTVPVVSSWWTCRGQVTVEHSRVRHTGRGHRGLLAGRAHELTSCLLVPV